MFTRNYPPMSVYDFAVNMTMPRCDSMRDNMAQYTVTARILDNMRELAVYHINVTVKRDTGAVSANYRRQRGVKVADTRGMRFDQYAPTEWTESDRTNAVNVAALTIARTIAGSIRARMIRDAQAQAELFRTA